MRKQEFLDRLREGLSGLPQDDVSERLTFYEEMIDDRMEEGLSEEEAVAELDSVEDIVAQTVAEIPLPRLVRESVRPKRRLQAWEIVLLVLGSPIWLALGIAALAIMLSVYIVLWALIVSLWAIELSLAVSAFGSLALGVVRIFRGDGMTGLLCIGAGLLLGGLSVFLCFGCLAATRGAAKLTKLIARGIKSLFIPKSNQKENSV